MNSMQLKDKIRYYYSKIDVDFNTLLRLYMYDRFIERLAKSKYKVRWKRYTENYKYAKDLEYDDVIKCINNIIKYIV